LTAGTGGTLDLTFTGNNNQMDGYSYDAAGNLLSDGSHTYFYDAEHDLVQVDGSEGYCQSETGTAPTACYTYDAEGRRVRRTVPGSGITDDYLYDLSGRYITQVSGTGFWIRGELFASDRHLGTYENDLSTPTTFFNHSDWLGTERVQTAVNGTACETIVSLPFGDGLTTSGSCDPSAEYFTGKEQDWESNLDNFEARFYSSQFGRFMSADPANAGATGNDPQTWNGYSYVRNSALNATDPTGLDCIYLNAAGTAVDHMLTGNNPDCTSDTDNGYYVNGTVDQSSISFGGGYIAYSYAPWNDSAGVAMPYPKFNSVCVDVCQDMSVHVQGTVDPDIPTMNAGTVPQISQQGLQFHYTPPTSPWGLFGLGLGCALQAPPEDVGSGGAPGGPPLNSTSETEGQGQTQVTTGGPNGGQTYRNNRPIIPNLHGGGSGAATARNLGGAANFVNSAVACGVNAATPR
jgi:RHS repeat-associated protein